MQETYFASVTTWQGDYGWEIDAIVEGFTSISDAALFGNSIRSLMLEEDCLILIDGDGEGIQLRDSQVRVFELKPELHSKKIINREDFVEKKIPIELFSEVKGLNKKRFSLLSFGVLDNNLNNILFDNNFFKKSEKTWKSTDFTCSSENELIFITVNPYLFYRHAFQKNFLPNYHFWTNGKTVALRKENSECMKNFLNTLEGVVVENSESF